jgi:hypothetical protein
MRVVEAMAAGAVGGCGVETLLRVAERAVGVGVTSLERKTCRSVVKARRRPRGGGVAVLAGVTERALVGVVLSVTIDAAVRRVAMRLSDRMALAAGCGGVGALERHVGASMVEGFREQHHDRRVGPLVLCVARAAESRGASGEVAVKPE